ncbi:M48 family metalloprotease [Tessaracoccus sp. HDW20]|uniref:M48 family metallopeptidase n=1 Tax=Tessaracoccus coleopterorum TaxID=2714950 RepID=UPI0018D406D6|nr:M48 family metalloprotease [Tessaracoccus coleopterorum]
MTELAALAETAPPDRIVIVAEVNASVAEVAGRRELEIGLPLLAAMTRGELRAVIAHELGHFAGGDTAYSSRIRGRLALIYSVRERVGPVWRWFFTLYGGLFSLVSGADSRRAELRADELALEAAGPDDAAGSFRSLYRAAAAWEVVDEHYAELFEAAGYRACLSEAVAMVARANREDIDKAVEEDIATEKASAFDTHPPVRERIARFEAARGTGPRRTDDAPALDLVGGRGWPPPRVTSSSASSRSRDGTG